MHRFFFFLIFISITNICFSQTEITWKDLEDVEFSDMYVEEVDEYVLYPHFGASVRDLEGKEIILSGYILAISPDDGYYVLSKGPFASCFFCGGGGPETIVELFLKSDKDYFMMDEFITMKGVFRLNSEDIYHCNYILDDAEVHSR
tara:strand:+ start:685 stop:1122 length:438 start_codon:yes stop_codon:yes gene_type:complete